MNEFKRNWQELKEPCPSCGKGDKICGWICHYCGTGISIWKLPRLIKDADKLWDKRPINPKNWEIKPPPEDSK